MAHHVFHRGLIISGSSDGGDEEGLDLLSMSTEPFVVRVAQDTEDVSTDDDLEKPDIGSGDWTVV